MSPAERSGPRLVPSPDGTSIAVWSSGTGPPLLLVHGSMSDHHRWRITEHLAEHRRVHALDRRGRGASTDGPVWSPEREVEDVVAVVTTLAAEAGTAVDVLGHSLGGYLALRAASRTPDVRRLVLYEPTIVESPQPAELIARMQAAVDAGRFEETVELMLHEVLHVPDDQAAALRSQPSWPARVATAPTLPREEGARMVVDDAELAAVSAPTLLVRGSDSPTFLQASVRRVAEGVPHAEVVTLEGHQHVADQTDPAMFARVVLDFLLV